MQTPMESALCATPIAHSKQLVTRALYERSTTSPSKYAPVLTAGERIVESSWRHAMKIENPRRHTETNNLRRISTAAAVGVGRSLA
jgi:hypothetical protein